LAIACASVAIACAQYAIEFTRCVRARAGFARHFSNAVSIPRNTASSGIPAFFHASISAQSSGESRNRPVPRACRKCSSISVK
jgi:hypothetical protein